MQLHPPSKVLKLDSPPLLPLSLAPDDHIHRHLVFGEMEVCKITPETLRSKRLTFKCITFCVNKG